MLTTTAETAAACRIVRDSAILWPSLWVHAATSCCCATTGSGKTSTLDGSKGRETWSTADGDGLVHLAIDELFTLVHGKAVTIGQCYIREPNSSFKNAILNDCGRQTALPQCSCTLHNTSSWCHSMHILKVAQESMQSCTSTTTHCKLLVPCSLQARGLLCVPCACHACR